MSQTFAGKHVAVTGASRGIGAAIVNAFAQEGASLSLLSRNRAALESQSQKALASGASKAHVFEMDVGVQSSVSQAFSEAQEALGPVDVLVNNAGAVESRPLARTSQGLWNTMMAVNLNGVFYCIDAVLSAMLERASGRIVNIASTAGLTGYPYIVPYCAAKHGVVGLTRALALEVVRSGITVNAICPGFTETDLLSDSAEKVGARTGVGKEEIEEKYRQQVPLGRFVKPQEIASAVLWLAEPEQAAITGQTITIAGGEVV